MTGRRPWPPDPALGAYDYDEETAAQSRHHKTKADRRKLFAIESRIIPSSKKSVLHTFGLDQWFIHGRYTTEARRDQAYRALVSKSKREGRKWSRTEWRKVG